MTNENQIITINDRKTMTATDVIDVESFTNNYIVINTKYGKMCVEGENLKINDLSQNSSNIKLTGNISGVFFTDESEKRGLFKRGR